MTQYKESVVNRQYHINVIYFFFLRKLLKSSDTDVLNLLVKLFFVSFKTFSIRFHGYMIAIYNAIYWRIGTST